MNSVAEHCNYKEQAAFRPSRRTWIIVLLATLSYFYIYLFLPLEILPVVIAAPLVIASLYFVSDPRVWGILLLGMVAFASKSFSFGPLQISYTTIIVVALFLLYVLTKITSFSTFPRFPLPIYLIGVAYLFQIASMFLSLQQHNNLVSNTIREANKIFIGALLLPVVYDWYNDGKWRIRVLKMVSLVLLFMTIYGIYQYNSGQLSALGDDATGYNLSGRIYSTIAGGPNPYSGILELLVPASLAMFFTFKEKKWKVIAMAGVLLGIQNVLLTFSRGGFLTVTFTLFVFLLYRYRQKVWVPILFLTIFIGVIVAKADEFKRQLTVFGDVNSFVMDSSILHRYVSYKGYWNEIENDPFNGVGWGSREYFHSQSSLYSFWEVRHVDSIEKIEYFGGLNSLVLEMQLKGGILSSISLFLIVAAMVLTSIKTLKTGSDKNLGIGFICGLAAFGAHQIFDNLIPWPQVGAFFWFLFAMLISVTYPKQPAELQQ